MLAQADSPISQVERPKTRRRGIKKPSKERIWTFCCCLPFGGNVNTNLKKFKDKSTKDLFPEYLLPPPCSRDIGKKTLVLDLDETLVHCRLDKSENPDIVITVPFAGVEYEVAVYKRPHFAEFLKSVAQHFEVVVFTASQRVYADKLLDILDPDKFIKHRLFRDSCVLVHGNYLKDLNILGRNLAQTVIIDNSPHVFGFQLDNGIPIETWFANNDQDSELLKLVPFLESLVNVEDVRPLVREQFQLYKKVVN